MRVLCIGHATWDVTCLLDGYPAENSKSEVHSAVEGGGGPAANAAYLLARWGVACGLAAVIGTDAYGDRIAAELGAAGVDLAALERRPDTQTPVSLIWVNRHTGSRTIVNRKAPGPDGPCRLPARAAGGEPPQLLLFDGHELPAALDAMARYPRAKTLLDAGSRRTGTEVLAAKVDYLVGSERFACQMCGLPNLASPEAEAQALATLYRLNGHPVVITQGERGLLRGTDRHLERWPAFRVKTVDTTGAGDIFHGALAYGLVAGLSDEASLRLATAAAALSTTVPGGRPSIPSLPQVEAFLRHAG